MAVNAKFLYLIVLVGQLIRQYFRAKVFLTIVQLTVGAYCWGLCRLTSNGFIALRFVCIRSRLR